MAGMRSAYVALALGLLSAFAAACGADAQPTSTPTTAAEPPTTSATALPSVEVAAEISSFVHQDLTIPVGTTVRWTNVARVPHTSTSGSPDQETGIWDSERLSGGESFAHTFNEVGTFTYFCTVHSTTMKATVTVTGAGAAAAPTPATPTPQPSPAVAPAAPSPTASAVPMVVLSPAAASPTSPPPAGTPTPTTAPSDPTPTTAAAQPTATPTIAPTATPTPTPTAEATATPSVEIGPSKDNTLFESAAGSLSSGCGEFLYLGKNNGGSIRRAVIAFDIAGSVPAGATVTGATLKLRMTRTQNDAQLLSLHKLVADWGEGASFAVVSPDGSGGGGGVNAATGDATWNHTFFDTATWVTPGGDYAPTASAEASVAAPASYRWSSDGMVADVQDWLADPSSNFGWIIVGNETQDKTTKKFAGRENTNEAHLPVLTVEFSGTGEPPAGAGAPACG